MTAPTRAAPSDFARHEAPLVRWRPWPLRALLLGACALAALVAAGLGEGAPTRAMDADLARLLRGMALVKFSIAAAALLAVLWRLAWPLSPRLAGAYALGAAAMVGACVVLWKLAFLAAAAVAFHAGLVTLGVASFVDGTGSASPWRRGR